MKSHQTIETHDRQNCLTQHSKAPLLAKTCPERYENSKVYQLTLLAKALACLAAWYPGVIMAGKLPFPVDSSKFSVHCTCEETQHQLLLKTTIIWWFIKLYRILKELLRPHITDGLLGLRHCDYLLVGHHAGVPHLLLRELRLRLKGLFG